jgi:hypothetical protein
VADGTGRDPSSGERDPESRDPAVCPVTFCPVGLALTAADIRPEVLEHLMAAGRELLLAAKAVLDARADATSSASDIERIEIG